MLEFRRGPEHHAIGRDAFASGVDLLLLAGELTWCHRRGRARRACPPRVQHLGGRERSRGRGPIQDGDVVLVKGSNAMA
jgi:UDP-N-acetylmuramyl pentapeptide synthase